MNLLERDLASIGSPTTITTTTNDCNGLKLDLSIFQINLKINK